MSPKEIIALGTYHDVQLDGHPLNSKLAGVISLICEHYSVQVILEEWSHIPEEVSFASTLAKANLPWRNVGTPNEAHFVTTVGGLNCHPPTYDPRKPVLYEYPPLNVQELRENYMVERARALMESYQTGLFIMGLAHLHSMLAKFKSIGFDVRGYSWIEQE